MVQETSTTQRRMNVTISGLPGSGKTTVAKILQEKLKLPYISTGQIFRKKAQSYKMSLQEFSIYAEKKPEIDKQIDKEQEKILRKSNVILEGRLAGWIAHLNGIPALKVWLHCDQKTRIKRIVKREGDDTTMKMMETKKREKSESKRYRRYYNIDIADTTIYDIVIDTTKKAPQEIAEIIIDAL